MGCSPFRSTCSCDSTNPAAIAPNLNPGNYNLVKWVNYNNAHVVKAHYHDCTNYEGMKIMVYKGHYEHISYRDPHFAEIHNAPIARFEPTEEGWDNACVFARQYI